MSTPPPYGQQPPQWQEPYGHQPNGHESPGTGSYGPDAHGQGSYGQSPYGPGPYARGSAAQGPYEPGPYGQADTTQVNLLAITTPRAPSDPPRRRGRGGGGKGRTNLLVLVAVLLVAVNAGLGWKLTSASGSSDPGSAQSAGGPGGAPGKDPLTGDPRLLWSVAGGADAGGYGENTATQLGSWITDKVVVRAGAEGLHAYDLVTGKDVWGFPVPDANASLCSASPTSVGGVGAIVYGPKDNCTSVAAVDTVTGKQLWSASLADPKEVAAEPVRIAQGREIIAATTGLVLKVHSARDGRVLWERDLRKASPACPMDHMKAEDATLVIAFHCFGKDTETVVSKDALTGKDQWSAQLPPGSARGSVNLLSAAPVVVHLRNTDPAARVDSLHSFDATGKAQPPIAMVGPYGTLTFQHGASSLHLEEARVVGNTLFAPTAQLSSGVPQRPSALVAFDLATGQPKWQAPAGNMQDIAMVAEDDRRVVILDTGKNGRAAQIHWYGTADGAPHAGGKLPPDIYGRAAAYLVGDKLVVLPDVSEKSPAIAVLGAG